MTIEQHEKTWNRWNLKRRNLQWDVNNPNGMGLIQRNVTKHALKLHLDSEPKYEDGVAK